MASIFSKIIAGEVPSHKIMETEHAFAFLDIHPLHEGHTLVVPKIETDYLFDVQEPVYSALWQCANEVAHALGKAIPCKRVGVVVIGLEVPHAHIHLVPIHEVSDIDFSRPKLSFTNEELRATAEKIKARL